MRKTFYKIVILFLVCVMLFSFCACNPDGNLTVPEKPQRERTKYMLIAEGVSEYSILLADNAVSNETSAANELQSVLFASSGALLPIVYESEIKLTDETPVISVGDTSFSAKRGVTTNGDLNRSGYVIKTLNNQVFIKSDGSKIGCMYAVYDFLYDAVGYRYYYIDEIYFDTVVNVPLYKYDDTVIPSFDFRATWYPALTENEQYRTHLRYNLFNEEYGWKAHTQTAQVVNYDAHKGAHSFGAVKVDPSTGETVPDHWFSNNGAQQLCWTAGEELEMQAALDLYSNIVGNPDKIYFQMGQADNSGFCTCPRCLKAKQEWGYNDAGLQINFANHVVELIQQWVKRDYPDGRDVRVVLFAYMGTETPPVVDDGNGSWTAFSSQVVPAEKLYFEFAPINTDFSDTLESANNTDTYTNLQKWHALLGDNERMSVWTYETNYSYFLYPFNNFDTFQPHMNTYAHNGITNMFSQGPALTNQPTFQEMRLFVESQIMWDVNRNYAELADEFIRAFYKDAAGEIKEYYDLIRIVYEQAAVLQGMNFSSIYSDISAKEIWTEGVVDAVSRLFDSAYAKIEHYKTDDPQTWQKLYDRLKELELTIIYTKLSYYRSNYSQSQINDMIDDFNFYCSKYGVSVIQERGASTYGMFDAYKQ